MRLQNELNPIVFVPSARKRKNDAKDALWPELPNFVPNLSSLSFLEGFSIIQYANEVIYRFQMTKSKTKVFMKLKPISWI